MEELAFTILYVDDLEREKKFYSEVVGLVPAFEAPGWIQFNTIGAALVLHPKLPFQRETPSAASMVHVGFRVDDLESEYRRLCERDVRFHAPPVAASFGKHATFLDPEGNAIDLLEWAEIPFLQVTSQTITNEIINSHPEAMEVLEEHGIRICGGCLVLLNSPIHQTAEYSGLNAGEASELVEELNEKIAELGRQVVPAPAGA